VSILTAGRYRLVAQNCTVRFVARSLGFSVPGALSVRSGEVLVDGSGTTVTAVLDAASFRTRNARRDRDVRSPRFLDAEHHPDIVFTGRWGGPGTPLVGDLTVKGVRAPAELEIVEVERPGRGPTVSARARIDRRLYPVGPARGPIGRWLDVELDIPMLSG
jgi:polyisoprenoid-binding protein YceI